MAKKLKSTVSSARIAQMAEIVRDTENPVPGGSLLNLNSNETPFLLPNSIQWVALSKIKPNPFQPRLKYSEESLKELESSIQQHGMLQPLVGKENTDGTYTLIAGHRRWLASKNLSVPSVPMLLREATDTELRLLALIENIQREDLHVVDKAVALAELADRCDTQEVAAQLIGMKRTAFHKWLCIRDLSQEVISVCHEIPDLSLRNLYHLTQIPTNRRLSTAKQILARSKAQGRDHDTAQREASIQTSPPGAKANVRSFLLRVAEIDYTCQLEVRAKTRKHVMTLSEMRLFLLQAISEIEGEMSPR